MAESPEFLGGLGEEMFRRYHGGRMQISFFQSSKHEDLWIVCLTLVLKITIPFLAMAFKAMKLICLSSSRPRSPRSCITMWYDFNEGHNPPKTKARSNASGLDVFIIFIIQVSNWNPGGFSKSRFLKKSRGPEALFMKEDTRYTSRNHSWGLDWRGESPTDSTPNLIEMWGQMYISFKRNNYNLGDFLDWKRKGRPSEM